MKISIEGIEWTGDKLEVGVGKAFSSLYQAINYSNLRKQPAVYLIYDTQLAINQQSAEYDCYFVGMKPLGEISINCSNNFKFHCNLYVENLIMDGILFRGQFDKNPIFKANKSILGKYAYPVSFYELKYQQIYWSNISTYYNGWKISGTGIGPIDTTKIYLDKVAYGGGGWPEGTYALDDKKPFEAEYTMIPDLPGIAIIDDYNGIAWGESPVNITYHADTKVLTDNTAGLNIDLSAGGEIKFIIPPEAGGDGVNYITLFVTLAELSTTDITEDIVINKEPIEPAGYGASYGVPGKLILVEQKQIPLPPPAIPDPLPWTNTFKDKIEIEGERWKGYIKTVGTGKDFATLIEAIDHSNTNHHPCVYLIYENTTFYHNESLGNIDLTRSSNYDSYFLGMVDQGYNNLTVDGACVISAYCSKLYVENLKINGFVPWYNCFPLLIKTNKVLFKDNSVSTIGCVIPGSCQGIEYINSCIGNTKSAIAASDLSQFSMNKVTYLPPWITSSCINELKVNDTKPIEMIFTYSITNGISGFTFISENAGMPATSVDVPFTYTNSTKTLLLASFTLDLSLTRNISIEVSEGKFLIFHCETTQLPTSDVTGTMTLNKVQSVGPAPEGYGPEYGTVGLLISIKKDKPKNKIIDMIVTFVKKLFRIK